MLLYLTVQNKRPLLDVFYRLRGFPHGYLRGKLRVAKYDGFEIVFPFIEDPAFDDVWLRDVYQEYHPQDDHVVIDVGAHMGFFTLKTVKHLKQIIAIEPDPANFKFLKYNISQNKVDDKVTICNLAVGDKNGRIFLDRSAYGYGRSRSTALKTDWSAEMKTVDVIAKEMRLEAVNLIKIDTEGYELPVLEGAKETLKNYNPDVLVAAYHFPQEHVLVGKFLKNYGYNVLFYRMPLFLSRTKESYIYATHA